MGSTQTSRHEYSAMCAIAVVAIPRSRFSNLGVAVAPFSTLRMHCRMRIRHREQELTNGNTNTHEFTLLQCGADGVDRIPECNADGHSNNDPDHEEPIQER